MTRMHYGWTIPWPQSQETQTSAQMQQRGYDEGHKGLSSINWALPQNLCRGTLHWEKLTQTHVSTSKENTSLFTATRKILPPMMAWPQNSKFKGGSGRVDHLSDSISNTSNCDSFLALRETWSSINLSVSHECIWSWLPGAHPGTLPQQLGRNSGSGGGDGFGVKDTDIWRTNGHGIPIIKVDFICKKTTKKIQLGFEFSTQHIADGYSLEGNWRMG